MKKHAIKAFVPVSAVAAVFGMAAQAAMLLPCLSTISPRRGTERAPW